MKLSACVAFMKSKKKFVNTIPCFTPIGWDRDGTAISFIEFESPVSILFTDEGGLTAHAAIVAREFGIPCIVGTKSATKVLKDGDLVEVDADKGIVKVLGV